MGPWRLRWARDTFPWYFPRWESGAQTYGAPHSVGETPDPACTAFREANLAHGSIFQLIKSATLEYLETSRGVLHVWQGYRLQMEDV